MKATTQTQRVHNKNSTIRNRASKNLHRTFQRSLRVETLESRRLLTVSLPELISHDQLNTSAGDNVSTYSPQSLSADGRYQVFSSAASDIVAGDVNGTWDVFLRDLELGTTQLISRRPNGTPANSTSEYGVISADGQYVAFSSYATNLAVTGTTATTGINQIYRWSRATGEISLVSVNSDASEGGNGYSYNPSISASGDRIAYHTTATDLLVGITDDNGSYDVYVRDLTGIPQTILVSRSADDPLVTGDSWSDSQQISQDGSRVVYLNRSTNIEHGTNDINGTGADLVVFDIALGVNSYVSVETDEPTSGNAGSGRTNQSLSADGRYEVFSSDANDLVNGDLNSTTDVFVRDLVTGSTTLISRSDTGQSANSSSHFPVISADGNYVAFYSHATNLDIDPLDGPNSTSGYSQIYRWHRATGTLELASPNFDNTDGAWEYSYNPSISGDGQRIVYQSRATDLVAGITDDNGTYDIYLRDFSTLTPATVLVSRSSTAPLTASNNSSDSQQISRDGSRVVYLTRSTDIQAGLNDVSGTNIDLVVFDVGLETNKVITVQTAAPSTGNADSSRTNQSLSADGRYEVFTSNASDLVNGDFNGTTDVFLRDLVDGTTTLISRSDTGVSANSSSHFPVISADGNYVAFYSHATNLDIDPLDGPNSTSGYSQIYRWHRPTGKIELASPNFDNTDGAWEYSYDPSISGDGQRITYQSRATDLVAGITDDNGWYDIFLRDFTPPTPTTVLVSRSSSDPLTAGNNWSDSQQISRDGSRILYLSRSTDVELGVSDANGANADLVSFEISTGNNTYVSVQTTDPTYANSGSSRTSQSLSGDGRYEVFTSSASDLVAGDTNGTTDVFLRDLVDNTTTLISRAAGGTTANSTSAHAVISADGHYVAFESYATDLDIDPLVSPNSTNSAMQVYRWHRETGELILISANESGSDGGGGESATPSISGDGQRISYQSTAVDMVPGINDVNGWYDIFVRDVPASTTYLASRSHVDAAQTGDSYSHSQQISRDGSTVYFLSTASDIADVIDGNGTSDDLFAFDITSGTNKAINLTPDGLATGNSYVHSYDISNDGQMVVFASYASDLHIADEDSVLDLFARDISVPFAGLDLVSTTTGDAAKGDWYSHSPSLSGDGRYVAFISEASNLSPLDGNHSSDIYAKDLVSRDLTLISVNASGTASGDNLSYETQISNDGAVVVFYSHATDLDGSIVDDNGYQDVFVRDWQAVAPSTTLASRHATGSGNNSSSQPELSDDGSRMVFNSLATDLASALPDVNGTVIDLFAFSTGSVELITVKANAAFTGAAGVGGTFDMSNNGQWVAYSSASIGVVADEIQGQHIYVRDVVGNTTERVSVGTGGTSSNGTSTSPSISGNGRFVAFDSTLDLSSIDTNGWQDIYVHDRTIGATTLVSMNHDGTAAGDSSSHEPMISEDGSTIAFYSYATDLDISVSDTNGVHDVFVSAWQTPNPFAVLLSRNAITAGNNHAWQPELSDDGSRVVFISNATDLAEGIIDANGTSIDIFSSSAGDLDLVTVKGPGQFTLSAALDSRFDLSDSGEWIAFSHGANGVLDDAVTGHHVYIYSSIADSTERVSVDSLGLAGNNSSYAPTISGDGRYVAFESNANLNALDTNWWNDVYVHDRTGATTTLISVNSDGSEAGSSYSYEPVISHDGSTVAFYSYADNLDATGFPYNGYHHVFIRNWLDAAPSTTLVSRNETEAGNNSSWQPELSDDGSRLVFISHASNLLSGFADVNGTALDIFSFSSGAVGQVSVKGDGRFTLSSVDPVFDISDDGLWVAFSSSAIGVLADNYLGQHVYVRDIQNDAAERVSVAADGSAGNNSSYAPSISGDGQFVAFETNANLELLDDNYWTDIYVRDRGNDSTILVTVNPDGTSTGDWYSYSPQISHDGSTVAFYSDASNLDNDVSDSNGVQDVFLRKWKSPAPVTDLVSVNFAGVTSGDNQAWNHQLSANGKTLAFLSYASDHTLLSDANGTHDVFVVRAAALALAANSADKLEGDSSTQAYTFTVTRSWFTGNEVTVDWEVVGIGANPADENDFGGSFPSGQVTFAPTETEKTITVLVSGELDVELDESFRVVLSDSTDNSQILVSTADGMIQNNDIDLELFAVDATKSEGNASTTAFTFTVNRLGYTGIATEVAWAVSGSGANPATAADFGGTFPTGTTTFAIGETTKTITVLVSSDNLVELNESFIVTLSNPSGNAEINIATATGTIVNDDSAMVNLVGVSANETTGALNFTVTLSNPVDVATTVAFSTLASGSATPGVDFTALSGHVVTFAAGTTTTQTVTVAVSDENLVELDETVNAQIAGLSAGGRSVTIATAAGTGTIVNDDSAVVNLVGVSANEATGALNFTVTLNNPVDVATTVAFSTLASGSATAGVDFTALSGHVVTFPAGTTTSQSVVVVVNDDIMIELDETVDAQLASLTAAGRSVSLGTALAIGTIVNDDFDVTPPVITSIIAASSTWQPAFIDTLDGGGSGAGNGLGYEIVAGSVALPWSGVNRLYVQFSEAVDHVSLVTTELRDSVGLVPFTIVYDSTTYLATLSFATPLSFSKLRLAASDDIQDTAGNALDGDGVGGAGGIFDFRFDVMPGDANGDGRTNGGDLGAFSAAFNAQAGQPNFNAFANWNGDSRVNGADLGVFSANFNRRLSTLGNPGAPFSGSGGAGAASFGGMRDAFFALLGEDDDEKRRDDREHIETHDPLLDLQSLLTPKRRVR